MAEQIDRLYFEYFNPLNQEAQRAFRKGWELATERAISQTKTNKENTMAHHGDDPFAQFANKEFAEFFKQLPERELENPFGATGRFPQGKLNDDDEGELQFGVAHTDEKVVIKFGKPIAWLGMDANQAEELGNLLITHAGLVRGKKD